MHVIAATGVLEDILCLVLVIIHSSNIHMDMSGTNLGNTANLCLVKQILIHVWFSTCLVNVDMYCMWIILSCLSY